VEFLKKKQIIVRISGKKKGKSSEISVKFENKLEKMSKWTRLFQSSLTNKQTKKLKTREFEEKNQKNQNLRPGRKKNTRFGPFLFFLPILRLFSTRRPF
jgi:hypothetical protein